MDGGSGRDGCPAEPAREDIPRLADHFIRIAAKRMNRRPPKFTNAAARQITAHDWPGNVRELQNAVERAVILAQGGPLQFAPSPSSRPSSKPPQIHDGSPVLTRADLKQRERESIAAALLGMRPTTLASRIKALGLRK